MAWSDYFTDPRLQQLIRIALENNRDLRVAALNVEKARAQFQIERAAIFPSVGGVASANRGNSQINGELGNTFSAGVAISAWEIDFFGRLRSLKEAALAQYFATDASRQASELALVSSVAQGWLTLIADEELLDISRRTLETREASAKLAQLSYEAGVTSALDLSQIESLAQAARATYAQQSASAVWMKVPWHCYWVSPFRPRFWPAWPAASWRISRPWQTFPLACLRTC